MTAMPSFEDSWLFSVLSLLSVPLLVALNGLFVAAEFALVAVRKTRVEEMVSQGHRGAKVVEEAVANLDRSIAATQLGITLASIALGWVGEPALARLLDPLFERLPAPWSAVATHSVATGVAFCLITFLHVVFGELIPKSLALQRPDGTALWVARPLVLFAKLTRPLVVRKARRPMALVRDDEGKTVGLLTLEDVLEEIVGGIEDEHDRPSAGRRWGGRRRQGVGITPATRRGGPVAGPRTREEEA